MLKLTTPFLLLFIALACVSHTNQDCDSISGTTFSSSGGQIQTIINTKCSGSDCHSSGGKGTVQWTIDTYNNLKPKFGAMYEAVENGTMPEAGSAPLTPDELDRFECWAKSGYPE